jgi:hypothetical protein
MKRKHSHNLATNPAQGIDAQSMTFSCSLVLVLLFSCSLVRKRPAEHT